jgi:pimeloyl-ACP methyl ester carboxylesterase
VDAESLVVGSAFVCGLDRAALIGVSEGGPLSILFAATFPRRVSHLVVYGSYTHISAPEAVRDSIATTAFEGWGNGRQAERRD